MQNFQKIFEVYVLVGYKVKGVILGVGKGIMGVFIKFIGGVVELVLQIGYGILYGVGFFQFFKQCYQLSDLYVDQVLNSYVKYVWKMFQFLGRLEVYMVLDVVLVRGLGQEYEGCLLLILEVFFVVSVSEDIQQQVFFVIEIDCVQDSKQNSLFIVQLKQLRVVCDVEVDGV